MSVPAAERVGGVAGLPVVTNRDGAGKAVVLGHPLWRHDSEHWTAHVAGAVTEVLGKGFAKVPVFRTIEFVEDEVNIDVDLGSGLVTVTGKGSKQRVVPLGELCQEL